MSAELVLGSGLRLADKCEQKADSARVGVRVATLMTYAGQASAEARVTRTGGLPLVPDDFDWPRCRTCKGAMQFIAQLLLDDMSAAGGAGGTSGRAILSIFMCQNDPGLCDEWDAASGGNRALLFAPNGLVAAATPPDGNTVLGEVSAVSYVLAHGDDYDQARGRWCEQHKRPASDVLGQLGGQPSWVQYDETPDCPACRQPMAFIAQLEEGHDYHTAANYGSGCAYVFACEPCGEAAFLWQQ